MFDWTVIATVEGNRSEEQMRRIYGEDAVISRVGKFNLIHLDNPGPEEVEKRVAEFDPRDLYEDDCPLCRMLREEGGDVILGEE